MINYKINHHHGNCGLRLSLNEEQGKQRFQVIKHIVSATSLLQRQIPGLYCNVGADYKQNSSHYINVENM